MLAAHRYVAKFLPPAGRIYACRKQLPRDPVSRLCAFGRHDFLISCLNFDIIAIIYQECFQWLR
jgi:hypothetical protein